LFGLASSVVSSVVGLVTFNALGAE